MKVVGVNGFGRIGRYFTRLILDDSQVNIALINDPADTKTLMHLLKYDSVHKTFPLAFEINGDHVVFENGKHIYFTHEKEPKSIPLVLPVPLKPLIKQPAFNSYAMFGKRR